MRARIVLLPVLLLRAALFASLDVTSRRA